MPVTPEMVAQEINRHADKSDEAAMVREYGRQEEAKRPYLEGKGRSLRFPVPDLIRDLVVALGKRPRITSGARRAAPDLGNAFSSCARRGARASDAPCISVTTPQPRPPGDCEGSPERRGPG